MCTHVCIIDNAFLVIMDSGQDPREGFFPSLWLVVKWLLAVTKKPLHSMYLHQCEHSVNLKSGMPAYTSIFCKLSFAF